MAVLTTEEKVKIRRAAARKAQEQGVSLRWIKNCLHDSAQAVEDIFSGAALQSAVSDAIDTASTPYGVSFTGQEKRWIAALIMELKYTRDIIG